MRLLKSAAGNGRNVLYVLPLQETLSTDPLPYDAPEFAKMPQTNCVVCQKRMPLQLLALHAEECSVRIKYNICYSISDKLSHRILHL